MDRFYITLKTDEERISELKSSQINISRMKQRKQKDGRYKTVGKRRGKSEKV